MFLTVWTGQKRLTSIKPKTGSYENDEDVLKTVLTVQVRFK